MLISPNRCEETVDTERVELTVVRKVGPMDTDLAWLLVTIGLPIDYYPNLYGIQTSLWL